MSAHETRVGPASASPRPRAGADNGGIPPGTTLGNYRIERLLGRGGMGSVYLAFDTRLRRQVALKLIDKALEGADSHQQLLHEARSAAALNHAGICTVYEVGQADGMSFVAMEYIAGTALNECLGAGALPLPQALEWGIQAADALAWAHARGVVHRDFKAANAIVDASGRLKLVDFGIARREYAGTEGTTTMTVAPAGSPMGTPYAMAPEQVRGETTDARTDIWALGVLLHEMLGGTKPFEGRTLPDLFSAILHDAPRPLPRRVPNAVRRIVARCLEKTPERRWQQASEVRAALEAARAGAGARPLWRRPWFAAAGIAALIAIGLALGGVAPRVRGLFDGKALRSGPVRLAVLPFKNPHKEAQYLVDGLADDLTAAFSRLRDERLSVVAGAATARYDGSAAGLAQMGRELDVNAILRGSFDQSSGRIQVRAELVQPDGRAIWQQTFQHAPSDLFMLEHELVAAASGALVLREPKGQGHVAKAEAYDLYLRARSHNLDTEEDTDLAIALLEKAVAADPDFTSAQASLALNYCTKALSFRADDPQWQEKAFAAARKAIELDAEAPEAHYVQAALLFSPAQGFAFREALAELRKALVAQPDFSGAWVMHGGIMLHVGHAQAAERDRRKAAQINPANVSARTFGVADALLDQQKFEQAKAILDGAPPGQWLVPGKVQALLGLGRVDEAAALLDGVLKGDAQDPGGALHALRAVVRAKRGDRAGAEADAAEATRVGRNFIHFHHTQYFVGVACALLGEFDRAQQWLEAAANNGFPNYSLFEIDANLAAWRATPRAQALLAKLRAEWEHIPGEPD